MSMDPSSFTLRITADEHGRRLVVEGSGLALPDVATGLLGGMVLGVVKGLLDLQGSADSEWYWRPIRVCADRAAGTLALEEVQLIHKEERSESIALGDVRGLTVRTRYVMPKTSDPEPPFSADAPRHVEAILQIADGTPAGRTRTIHFKIAGLDTPEKAADFAYRLGAAMGLEGQRVIVSDPRRIEIELRPDGGAGLEAMPRLAGPADYLGGRIAPDVARAAAELRMRPVGDPVLEPPTRLTKWSPGDEVRIDKPLEGMAFGCLPVAAGCFLFGPAIWFLSGKVPPTIIGTILGLVFGSLAVIAVAGSLPQHVRIAWPEQAISVSRRGRRRRLAFHQLAELELRCVRRYGRSGQTVIRRFGCTVQAHARAEGGSQAAPLELISTSAFEDDPETPYEMLLPLTKALAEALGVPWRVTDYS